MPEVVGTPEEPILRVHRSAYGRAGAEAIAVADIDPDYEHYPDLTELIVLELLGSGQYDDSDAPDTIVLYSTEDRAAVRAQWEALKAAHPTLWADPPAVVSLDEPLTEAEEDELLREEDARPHDDDDGNVSSGAG
jgi:hypothetical protein